MENYYKVYVVVEKPEHHIMHCADLTDRGLKGFVSFYELSFSRDKPLTKRGIDKIVNAIYECYGKDKIEMLFFNGECIVDRRRYAKLSDGKSEIFREDLLKERYEEYLKNASC